MIDVFGVELTEGQIEAYRKWLDMEEGRTIHNKVLKSLEENRPTGISDLTRNQDRTGTYSRPNESNLLDRATHGLEHREYARLWIRYRPR